MINNDFFFFVKVSCIKTRSLSFFQKTKPCENWMKIWELWYFFVGNSLEINESLLQYGWRLCQRVCFQGSLFMGVYNKLTKIDLETRTLPWECSARFLDPSGPSKTTESWICCAKSLKKFCLAVSLSWRLPGNTVCWLVLNLDQDDKEVEIKSRVVCVFLYLTMKISNLVSLWLASSYLTVKVCVGSKSALLTSSKPVSRAWSPSTSTWTDVVLSWGAKARRRSSGDPHPTGRDGLRDNREGNILIQVIYKQI